MVRVGEEVALENKGGDVIGPFGGGRNGDDSDSKAFRKHKALVWRLLRNRNRNLVILWFHMTDLVRSS